MEQNINYSSKVINSLDMENDKVLSAMVSDIVSSNPNGLELEEYKVAVDSFIKKYSDVVNSNLSKQLLSSVMAFGVLHYSIFSYIHEKRANHPDILFDFNDQYIFPQNILGKIAEAKSVADNLDSRILFLTFKYAFSIGGFGPTTFYGLIDKMNSYVTNL